MHQFIPSLSTIIKTGVSTILALLFVMFKSIAMDLAIKIIEWSIPEMLTKEKEWLWMKIHKEKLISKMKSFQGMTIEEIAEEGKKDSHG